jgi:hypothetical protein
MTMFTNLARKVARKAGELSRRVAGTESDWLKKKRLVDREFDARHGVDTGGVTHLKGLGIPGTGWRDGVSHIAIDPDEFRQALDGLGVDLRRLTFIDLGAGKGRALLLASLYPFRRIIGIEFGAPLLATARKNIAGFKHPDQQCRDFELHEADATRFELPNEPGVLYLYDPFGLETMRKVAKATHASLLGAPRDFHVLYLNPFHISAWLDLGFTARRGPHFTVLRLPYSGTARPDSRLSGSVHPNS